MHIYMYYNIDNNETLCRYDILNNIKGMDDLGI